VASKALPWPHLQVVNILRGRPAPIPSRYSPSLRNLVNMLLRQDPKVGAP
jgi:hypothetical protein